MHANRQRSVGLNLSPDPIEDGPVDLHDFLFIKTEDKRVYLLFCKLNLQVING